MKLFSFNFFILISLTATISAQQDSTELWVNAISKRMPLDILLVLTEDPSMSWPTIPSAIQITSLPKDQQAESTARLKLAQLLVAELKNHFTKAPKSFDSLKNDMLMASEAAKRIRASKGYVNLVLSDIIYRGALFQLSAWLLLHPLEQQFVLTAIDSLEMRDVDIRALLLQFQREDDKLVNLHLALDKPVASESLPQQLISIGIPEEMVMSVLTDYDINTASDHLNSPDLIRLIARISATRALANYSREACEYIRRGGKLEKSELEDFAKYKKLMSDRIYRRKANGALEQVNYGEGIIGLIELHSPNSELASQYLKITFD